jgi:hypothetical protein
MGTPLVPLKPVGPLYSALLCDRRNWEADHARHLKHVKEMKGVLDHTPPWRDDHLFANLRKAKKWYEASHGAEIARENKLLVDKLYTISKNSYVNQQAIRRGETVAAPGIRAATSRSLPELKTGGKVHDALRRRNAETIEMDNEQLVRRILNVKKTINVREFSNDFKQHVGYSALRSRLPKHMQAKPSPAKPRLTRVASEGTRGFLIPGDLTPKTIASIEDQGPPSVAEEPPEIPRDAAIFLPSLGRSSDLS